MNVNGQGRLVTLQITLAQLPDGRENTTVAGPIDNPALCLRMLEETKLILTRRWLLGAQEAPKVVGVHGVLGPPPPHLNPGR